MSTRSVFRLIGSLALVSASSVFPSRSHAQNKVAYYCVFQDRTARTYYYSKPFLHVAEDGIDSRLQDNFRKFIWNNYPDAHGIEACRHPASDPSSLASVTSLLDRDMKLDEDMGRRSEQTSWTGEDVSLSSEALERIRETIDSTRAPSSNGEQKNASENSQDQQRPRSQTTSTAISDSRPVTDSSAASDCRDMTVYAQLSWAFDSDSEHFYIKNVNSEAIYCDWRLETNRSTMKGADEFAPGQKKEITYTLRKWAAVTPQYSCIPLSENQDAVEGKCIWSFPHQ